MNGYEARDVLSDIIAFVGAVLRHWIALMSGIVSITLYALLRWRGYDVRFRTYGYVGLAAVFLAAFLAYEDERHRPAPLPPAPIPAAPPPVAPPPTKPGPRFLTDAQVADLAVALRSVPAPSSVEVTWLENNGECESYAQGFLRLFGRVLGWRVETSTAAMTSPIPLSGLEVRALPGDQAAGKLTATLVLLGIPVDPAEDANQPPGKLSVTVWRRPE